MKKFLSEKLKNFRVIWEIKFAPKNCHQKAISSTFKFFAFMSFITPKSREGRTDNKRKVLCSANKRDERLYKKPKRQFNF